MHNNLGIALATSGRPAESLASFRQAAALNPSLPNIEENWGKALLLLGRRSEAAEHFARAEKLRAPALEHSR
jgi:Flp pilus assembly protein TadD